MVRIKWNLFYLKIFYRYSNFLNKNYKFESWDLIIKKKNALKKNVYTLILWIFWTFYRQKLTKLLFKYIKKNTLNFRRISFKWILKLSKFVFYKIFSSYEKKIVLFLICYSFVGRDSFKEVNTFLGPGERYSPVRRASEGCPIQGCGVGTSCQGSMSIHQEYRNLQVPFKIIYTFFVY